MTKSFTQTILCLILLCACGASKEEEFDLIMTKAKLLLTQSKCDEALFELGQTGYRHYDAKYLQLYSSALACKGGFSVTSLFGELADLTTTQAGILGSLSGMASSPTTSSTNKAFINLQSAIDTLLYAGNISTVSAANRAAEFNSTDASNMNMQALYMVLAQLGRYFYLHGNTNAAGKKGARDTPETNDCLTDYTFFDGGAGDSQVLRAFATGGGTITPCAGNADGHSELKDGAPNRNKYLCQGVILFNNLLDLLSNISLSGDNTSELQDLQSNIGDLCTLAGLGAVCTVKTQSVCESMAAVPADLNSIESFFVVVFETMLTDL